MLTHVTSANAQPDQPPGEADVEAARQYVRQLRAFYVHAGAFAAGMVIMFAVNLVTNLSAGTAGRFSAWWSVWALLGWGIGIAVHGLVVLLNRPSSSSWEERQIDKVLSRSRRR